MRFRNFISIIFVFCIYNISAQELAMVKEKNKIGYIDKSGVYVIEPQFKEARSFSENLAGAIKDKKWGFIDASGNWVVEPRFDMVKYFSSGYAVVEEDNQWKYIDKTGKDVEFPKSDKIYDFNYGVAFFRNGDKIGLLGTDGKLILNPTYDLIKSFIDGHARVRNNGLWGMINTKGEVVIPLEYRDIGNYNPKAVRAEKTDSHGIIINGVYTIVKDVDKIWDFNDDSNLTRAKKGFKVGFINTAGEWVIKPFFEDARDFNQGLAPVFKDRKWGFINEEGNPVIPFVFEDAEKFSNNGLAAIKIDKWGFIDRTGTVVIEPDYYIFVHTVGGAFVRKFLSSGFIDDFARVRRKNKWGFITENGQLLSNKWYQNAEPFVKVD